MGIKIPVKEKWQSLFAKKSGIEIGGPSPMFKNTGHLPIYPVIQSLDGVNFSTSTVWEGELSEGNFYKYQDKAGHQYIAEGTYLPQVADSKYDFVLSCNNLEHIANPIAAVSEWKRIIKKGGVILLVLPNKLANFDHDRPYTTINHLVNDFNSNVGEEDNTHMEEILKLHDLKRDPQAGTYEMFTKRCSENFINRCMHHHVFNQHLLREIFEYCGMEVKLQYSSKTDHFIAAIRKT
ncbi:MAG: methyltransferase domain-containing protein [Ferruginibacter sp.]